MADNFNSQGVKTENDGDVVVKITDGTDIALVSAAGRLLVDSSFTPSGTQDVNVTQIGGNAVNTGSGAAGTGTQRVSIATDDVVSIDDNGGSITVDGAVDISDGGNSITVDDGGTTLSIDDGGGTITVDGTVEVTNDAGNPLPISATTSANAVGNPLYTRLTDGTAALGTASNPLAVSFEGANDGTLIETATATSTNLAAAASANFDTAVIGGTTGKLLHVAVACTQPVRVDVGTYNGTTFTSKLTYMQPAFQTLCWTTPDRDWIDLASGGSNVFRVRVTNLDNAKSSDVHTTILHEEV